MQVLVLINQFKDTTKAEILTFDSLSKLSFSFGHEYNQNFKELFIKSFNLSVKQLYLKIFFMKFQIFLKLDLGQIAKEKIPTAVLKYVFILTFNISYQNFSSHFICVYSKYLYIFIVIASSLIGSNLKVIINYMST